jgi:hypothetical protein
MHVDPTQSGQSKTHASTHVASRAAASASQFSRHLAKASSAKSDTSWRATTPPKGEKTQAVPGHKYAEVVAGPRNGLFVNKSGNARDGMAFARVMRGGKEFHIYGSGKNRIIVQVKHRDTTPDTTKNTPTNNPSNAATPGSSTTSSPPPAPATDPTGAPVGTGS